MKTLPQLLTAWRQDSGSPLASDCLPSLSPTPRPRPHGSVHAGKNEGRVRKHSPCLKASRQFPTGPVTHGAGLWPGGWGTMCSGALALAGPQFPHLQNEDIGLAPPWES